MDIHEISMQIEKPLFQLRKYIDQAEFIMQDVMEDYFYIEDNDKDLAFILTYGFRRAGAKAGVVDDVLHYMNAQIKALEALAGKIDEALKAEEKTA